MAEQQEPLSAEEVAAIDAEYLPFPDFGEWASTFPRVQVWERRLQQFEELANQANEGVLAAALEVAVRAAAFDTGAIEGLYPTDRGLTMTVAQQAGAWEQQVAAHGTDALALFKAQLATYELVLDVATRRLEVNEAWIRRLHEDLTAPQGTYTVHTPVGVQQHPLPRGEYKKHPNHVRLQDGSPHAYAPVDRTRDEMRRLVEQLQTERFEKAHPIIQAAYAHYGLVCVHPFADGNGRVARALGSAFLFRAARVPLLVFADQRDPYLDALATADAGTRDEFNKFVGNAAIAALELVSESIRTALAPSADAASQALRELVMAQGGLGHLEIDQLGFSLLSEFAKVLQDEVAQLQLPPEVTVQVRSEQNRQVAAPDGYRLLGTHPLLHAALHLYATAPSEARRYTFIRPFVAMDLDEESDLYFMAQEGTDTGSTFSLTDIRPVLSAAAEQRMRMLARRVLGIELTELLVEAGLSLQNARYPHR